MDRRRFLSGGGQAQIIDPSNPADVIRTISGLNATDINRGDSATSQILGLVYAATGAPGINVAATQINTQSALAVASYRFSDVSIDSLACPNTTYGEYDGTENFLVAFIFRTTNTTQTVGVSKRAPVAPGPPLGYEVGINGAAMLLGRYETDSGSATLAGTVSLNDDAWHCAIMHFDVAGALFVLATEAERVSVALVAGDATNAEPYRLGDGPLLQATGQDMLIAMSFNGPQLQGIDEQQLAKEFLFGLDPQKPAGYGAAGDLAVGREP